MNLFVKLRGIAARRALQRKIKDEMSALTDAELNDLNLSYARISEMSRQQALIH